MSVTFIPEAGFSGEDQFTYRVTNPDGGTSTGTVSVDVVAVEVPLAEFVIDPDVFAFDVDAPIAVGLLGGNPNGWVASIANLPDGLSFTEGGVLSGSLPVEFDGELLVRVVDEMGRVQTAPIRLTVREQSFGGDPFLSPALGGGGNTDADRIARARRSVADWEDTYSVTAAELAARRDGS